MGRLVLLGLGLTGLALAVLVAWGGVHLSTWAKGSAVDVVEHEQGHAWCYVLSGESIDCVPKVTP